MKMPLCAKHFSGRLFAVCCALVFLTACATNRVDWNTRIGNYTFDQAVLDYGPPDKTATLTDGTRVAEWLTSRGYSHGAFMTYSYHYPWTTHYVDSPSPDYYLRLTFGPDGQLSAWRRVTK